MMKFLMAAVCATGFLLTPVIADTPTVPTSNLYLDSTVRITGEKPGYGSGAVIAPNKILTAAHVLRQMKSDFRIHTRNGTYRVETAQPAHEKDLALLTLAVDVDVPTVKASCRIPELLETLISAGNGLALPTHLGVLSVVGFHEVLHKWHKGNVVLVQGSVNQGDSGGPVFDKNGVIVGVVSSGYNYNIPNPQTGMPDAIQSGLQNIVPLADVPEFCTKGEKR